MISTLIWILIRIIITMVALAIILLFILVWSLIINEPQKIKRFVLYRLEDFFSLWNIDYLKDWQAHD